MKTFLILLLSIIHFNLLASSTYPLPAPTTNASPDVLLGYKKLKLILDDEWTKDFLHSDYFFLFIHTRAYIKSTGNLKKDSNLLWQFIVEIQKHRPLSDLSVNDVTANLLKASDLYEEGNNKSELNKTLLKLINEKKLYPKYEPEMIGYGPKRTDPTDGEVDYEFEEGGIGYGEAEEQARRRLEERNTEDASRHAKIATINPQKYPAFPVIFKFRTEADIRNTSNDGGLYMLRHERPYFDLYDKSGNLTDSLELPQTDDYRYPQITSPSLPSKVTPEVRYLAFGQKHLLLIPNDKSIGSNAFSVWISKDASLTKWTLLAAVGPLSKKIRSFEQDSGIDAQAQADFVALPNGNLGLKIWGTKWNEVQYWNLYDLNVRPF